MEDLEDLDLKFKLERIVNVNIAKIKDLESKILVLDEIIIKILSGQELDLKEKELVLFCSKGYSKNPVPLLYDKIKEHKDKIKHTLPYTDIIHLYKTYRKKVIARRNFLMHFQGISLKDKVINVDGRFYIGKSKEGNQKIYASTHRQSDFCWHHADVKGGGLVANKMVDSNVAGAWALVHSKYLSTTNSSIGYVSMTENIENAPAVGSFQFMNRKTRLCDAKDAKLYIGKNDHRLSISYYPTLNTKWVGYCVPADPTQKVVSLEDKLNLKGANIKNKSLIYQLIPSRWDLKFESYE